MKYLLSISLYLLSIAARADVVTVAVASNFVPVFENISSRFESQSLHEVRQVAGASGKLYAQILRGAPFDLFLSADHVKPRNLIEAGLAQKASLATYAIGQLALWSNVDNAEQWKHLPADKLIASEEFDRLAIANPAIAPYGSAAKHVLSSLGLFDDLKPTLIVGENVSQVFHFLHSKNAELGFVSRAQVMSLANAHRGTFWPIPEKLHPAIRQDMVLLTRTESAAAVALHNYLQSREVRAMIIAAGYIGADN
ncbi:MAG: molybdate ABC transporter substrate-binding protein [Pseudomonadota bacterium]